MLDCLASLSVSKTWIQSTASIHNCLELSLSLLFRFRWAWLKSVPTRNPSLEALPPTLLNRLPPSLCSASFLGPYLVLLPFRLGLGCSSVVFWCAASLTLHLTLASSSIHKLPPGYINTIQTPSAPHLLDCAFPVILWVCPAHHVVSFAQQSLSEYLPQIPRGASNCCAVVFCVS